MENEIEIQKGLACFEISCHKDSTSLKKAVVILSISLYHITLDRVKQIRLMAYHHQRRLLERLTH